MNHPKHRGTQSRQVALPSIFNFTTGHPVLDAWLAGDFPAPEKDTVARHISRDASIPALGTFEHPPIASVESGRSEAENEASPGAHPFGISPEHYWAGHNGLRKRS